MPENQLTVGAEGEGSTLPSDAGSQEQSAIDKLIETNPEYEFLKEYGDIDELKSKLSGSNDDATGKGDGSGEEQEVDEQSQNKEEAQQALINELIPEFVANGNKLSQEMIDKLKETGLDERDIKLGMYEIEKSINESHSIVGGKEEYESMIAWAKENLSEEDKASFNLELTTSNRKFAIRGLYSMYADANGKAQKGRISGDSHSQSTVTAGYSSKKEMFDDMAYLRKNPRDRDAQRRHEAKMKKTNPAILR